MNFRTGLLILTPLLALMQRPAYATLIGSGKTVQAFYYNGVLADPEGEEPVGVDNDDPASLASPVNYQLGAADFSTISVDATQIIITNQAAGAPFCVNDTPGTACTDAIDGFDFKFTGENIIGVTVDSSSASTFLPVDGTFQGNTHLGLQLISPNEIRVDVTGDAPPDGFQLILDVDSTPEPSTLFLCGPLVLGLFIRRAFRRPSPSVV